MKKRTRGGGRPPSAAWTRFKRRPNKEGIIEIHCDRCDEPYADGTPPKRLLRHLLVCSKVDESDKAFARSDLSRLSGRAAAANRRASAAPGPEGATPDSGGDLGTSKEYKEVLDEAVADFYFGCNVALTIANHRLWRNLLRKLRPSYRPPGYDMLRYTLLPRKAADATVGANTIIKAAHFVSVSIDGGSNIKRERVLHVIVCTPAPVFWSRIVHRGVHC